MKDSDQYIQVLDTSDVEMAHCGGLIQGTLISCPLHGAVFDLKTGEVMSPPAFEDLKTFKLKIEGTSIKVLKPET